MAYHRKFDAEGGRGVYAVVEDFPDGGFHALAWLGFDPTIAAAVETLRERLNRGRALQLQYGLAQAPASVQLLNECVERQLEQLELLERLQRDTGLP
jgi:hypothetical protein